MRFEMAAGVNSVVFGLHVSRNGRLMVFQVLGKDGVSRLAVRPMDGFTATILPSTGGADRPFLSPDGRWVGFFQDGQIRKVLTHGGGAPVQLATYSVPFGASWGDTGEIVAAGIGGKALWLIPEGGGKPKQV